MKDIRNIIFLLICAINIIILGIAHLAECQSFIQKPHIPPQRSSLIPISADHDESKESEGRTADISGTAPGDEDLRFFVATEEWQEIKPGQKVPSGLHYRMNLETGKNEAKLLSKETKNEVLPLDLQPDADDSETDEHSFDKKVFLMKEMEKALKNLKAEKSDNSIEPGDSKPYRSYEQLKQDFGEINMKIQTDSEILMQHLDEYKSKDCSHERKLELLHEFEYLVHQYDNAINFVRTEVNGLDIVKEALNSTDENFRSLGAFILGTAAQNNPKVKVALYENGLLHNILTLLAIERRPAVRHKLQYALSTLLFNFPFAQKKMVEMGGLDILIESLTSPDSDLKQLLQVINLLSVMMEERRHVDQLLPGNQSKRLLDKWRQYDEIKLIEILRLRYQYDVCSNVIRLLDDPSVVSWSELDDRDPVESSRDHQTNNYDAQEKILRFLVISTDHFGLCTWSDLDPVLPKLMALKDHFLARYYQETKEQDDDGKFWLGLSDSIAKIIKFYHSDKLKHDEL